MEMADTAFTVRMHKDRMNFWLSRHLPFDERRLLFAERGHGRTQRKGRESWMKHDEPLFAITCGTKRPFSKR